MQNWEETLLVQFGNSPSMKTILNGFNQAIDPSNMINSLYDNVINPATATGWGLDVWGRIVGIGRVFQVAASQYMGFDEADDGSGTSRPMNDGIFYSGGQSTSNFALTDEWYRKLIFAKAAANISTGSLSSINAILMSIFSDRGLIWVEETDQNTMTFRYNWNISPVEVAIVEQSGIILRPSTISFVYNKVGNS